MIGNAGVLAEPISQVRLLLKPWRQSLGTWAGRLARAAALSSGSSAPLSPVPQSRSTGYAQARSPRGHRRGPAPASYRRAPCAGCWVIWSITVHRWGQLKVGQQVFQHKGGGSNTRRPLPISPRAAAVRRGWCQVTRANAPARLLPQGLGQLITLGLSDLCHPCCHRACRSRAPQLSPALSPRQPALLSREYTTSGSDGASSCWPNTRLAQEGR